MRYAKFGKYRVYENGQIYSEISNKVLRPDVTVDGYEQVTLATEIGPVRTKVHRLVACAFVPHEIWSDMDRDAINHIDGNKHNNHYTNLEWCTTSENNKHARITGLNNVSQSNTDRWKDPDFRARTSAHFSQVKIALGLSKGQNNGRFRYLVTDQEGKELSREEVSKRIDRCMSSTDVYIRRAASETIPLFVSHGLKVCDTKKSQSTIEKGGSTVNLVE